MKKREASWILLHAAVVLTPGLTYSQRELRVQGRPIQLEELRRAKGASIELRAMPNPRATHNPVCRHGYGGVDLPGLLAAPEATPSAATASFTPLAATNGTLFRIVHEGKYSSNHMLWSKGQGLLAPIRKAGGTTLFVADASGGRELKVAFEQCKPPQSGSCVRVVTPELAAMGGLAHAAADFTQRLEQAFPTMTLAVQSNMALHSSPNGNSRAFDCPENKTNDWRCAKAARTLLCSRSDGSLSLMTTPGAYPSDLVTALTAHRDSGLKECRLLYNLDGGASTQMGRLEGGAWSFSGSRMETSEPGCSAYRPVDHYFVFGKPKP
jgi:hypothetical protein